MLEIKNASFYYGDICALKEIDLQLKEGIYALLGPNGAGKSTLMKLLCKQREVQEGEIRWCGRALQELDDAYYRILGYAPQQQGLYEEFSGYRFLAYMALLKGIEKKKIKEEIKRVAGLVHMEEHLHKKCRTYSGGMKQRLLCAQALLGEPKLLLFDEPSAGLDPKERFSLRKVFADLKRQHILLIATHVVSDIETIADEIIILKEGQIAAQGSREALAERFHKASLEEVYLSLFQEEEAHADAVL